MIEVRCGNCGHWIGEAPEEIIHIEVVEHGSASTVKPPRDLRRCASCLKVNVFVARASLDGMLAASVR